MTSAAVLEDIAGAAGVPLGQVTAQGPYADGPGARHGHSLGGSRQPDPAEKVKYRLTFVA